MKINKKIKKNLKPKASYTNYVKIIEKSLQFPKRIKFNKKQNKNHELSIFQYETLNEVGLIYLFNLEREVSF